VPCGGGWVCVCVCGGFFLLIIITATRWTYMQHLRSAM